MAAPEMELDYVPTNGKAKFTKWIPKKWRPEYARVVALSATGLSNKVVAEKTGFTKEHVSNILNLPQAEELRERIIKAMEKQATTDIPNALQRIAEKTVQRLETLVNDDEKFKDSPFAIIDRGMDVLKGLNHLKGGGNGAPVQGGNTFNGPTIIVPASQVQNLIDGMSKADEVMEIHSGDQNGSTRT